MLVLEMVVVATLCHLLIMVVLPFKIVDLEEVVVDLPELQKVVPVVLVLLSLHTLPK
jgi:hypothetical protein